ncbi:MAG TPA: hypothetical protein VNZ57_11615 [Longimicrobiales bacterium]|nr:hypothetical protein [Longimicrobiales bacterium]
MTGKQKRALAVAGAIVAAFLVGFLWQYTRATVLGRELRATQDELALERLETTLAAATVHAYYGNFETSRQLMSQFFTDAATVPAAAPPAIRSVLATIQGQRDELITSLARSAPESGEILADYFIQLRVARGEIEGQGPTGDPTAGRP